MGPVGPVGPVGPLGPVGPGLPEGPTGPAGPGGPFGPVVPCTPVAPVAPVAPTRGGQKKHWMCLAISHFGPHELGIDSLNGPETTCKCDYHNKLKYNTYCILQGMDTALISHH